MYVLMIMVVFRYAGYCPQLKYHVGQSYGQLTAKLLSSPEVSHSQRLVLHTGRFPSTENNTGPRDEIWRGRNGVNRKLEKMIPGYTGYDKLMSTRHSPVRFFCIIIIMHVIITEYIY